ncbi:PVC-type heme-binding CxxCH protein [Schlesneria sp. T3-172]|uniref:PVC-type heme-binding CxxCH protein n=1 Tax=Schlesneria sphaerica TaxID=3373610 RepID=UPI0037CBDF59
MRYSLFSLLCLFVTVSGTVSAEEFLLTRFERQPLTEDYFSEGASFGDLNQDGIVDIVHGPYWWEGPKFERRHEIYPAKSQNRRGYSDNFFSWVYDFNGDGWNDVLTVGLPGTPGFIFENPQGKNLDKHWKRHQFSDQVGNESPQFVNFVGDAQPELVFARDGVFGYIAFDPRQSFANQTFHVISDKIADTPFGHGLGVGDVNGDGRLDLLFKGGWLEQPESLAGDPLWKLHPFAFAGAGGGDMFAYDVDGDGDNDVITSLNAHAFGLAWYEQTRDGNEISFVKHLIMGEKREESPYGVLFTELHTLALHDMDGDGLKDIVTGKTYWSHHEQSPMWDAGAVVYWFKLERSTSGINWIPYQIDGEAGVGRQLSVGDLNGDKRPDIVVGGMKGCHVLSQTVSQVTKAEWQAAQPKKSIAMAEGLSPEEAAANMTAPDGFVVSLAAGEPLVHQPVAFTLDHRGRLWVAEAYTYPIRAADGEGKDKIVILEDTDGDGRFEKRKVFIEGLNLVSGLELGFGGVWVGAAPYLMFIPDQDGDDVPDQVPNPVSHANVQFPRDVPTGATVLLDGFGWQDTHETLNSFIWGPDGWLYGCHGVFTHSKVGKPGTADKDRQGLNAGVWRYHPTKHQFEVFSHGTSNPWGVDFNDRGHAFITACVIPHLWHMVQGGRYHRQGGQHFNPYTFEDIKTIADHAHYVGNLADHAWWGHEPHAPADTLAAGGGHAHCGAMIYLGDNWPAGYRNQIFMHNVHGNRINECLLEPSGSGYIGKRAPDTLIANDRWFRGINLKYGPDGSVYLIDWYDKNACHRTNPEIWDRTNGRVYNLAYEGTGRPDRKQIQSMLQTLSGSRLPDLVALLDHPNEWYVRMARRRLQEAVAQAEKQQAGSPSLMEIRSALRKKLDQADGVPQKLRIVWTIHAVFGLDHDLGMQLLALPGVENEDLRAWAIQLMLEDRAVTSGELATLVTLAKTDSSPVVRLYLASALQRLPLEQRWELASALVGHGEDADDHNLPLVLWYGIEPLVEADPKRAIAMAQGARIERVARYIVRRAAATEKTLNAAIEWLASASEPATQKQILEEINKAFEGRVNIPQPAAWTPAYDRLVNSPDAEIRSRADQVAVAFGDKRILPRMRALLQDSSAPLPQRQKALELIVKGRDTEAADSLLAVLDETELRGPAIRALGAYDKPKIPDQILERYGKLPDSEKRDAINTLVGRPRSAEKLFDAIEKGTVPRTDVHAYHVQQLLGFKDEALAKRIQSVWGDIRPTASDKLALIAKHKEGLSPARLKTADLGNGRRLFAKTCAACHVLFGEGGKIGPDITGSNRANVDYLLENILDPSSIVGKDYRMTVIATTDGRVISGLIQKETDSAVTLRTINDTVVVAKSDIDERTLSELSLMPEGQMNQLTPDEQRDLIAYLGSPHQVALRGPKGPIDPQTGRVPNAIEGEGLKIVGKSAGNVSSQPMAGFTKDKWSGNDHLWWTGASPGAKLELELPVETEGTYEIDAVLTMARDYGIVQLLLDDEPIGAPADCYDIDVVTTGELSFGIRRLTKGTHKLGFQITGANPNAVKGYMVGLDYIKLTRTDR